MVELEPEEVHDTLWREESSIDPHGYVHIHLRTGNDAKNNASTTPEVNLTMNRVHTFPTALPDWSNLNVIHKNTLPPRASFYTYDNVTDALTRDVTKSKMYLLSGTWKFNLAKSPFDAPPEFYEHPSDSRGWGNIEVPGMWQLQGYGKGPQYE
jgi:beta-galactosidase